MFEGLEKELNNFLDDIVNNIKDPKDLEYMVGRTDKLIHFLLDETGRLVDYNEEKMKALINRQKQVEEVLIELKEKVENMYEDIYDEEEGDFEIICPYCNFEFDANIDEDLQEIRCPECGNLIELDWNGNPDDEPNSGCGGNCNHCGGCE